MATPDPVRRSTPSVSPRFDPALSNRQKIVRGRAAPHMTLSCYALTSAGFQMLILRVSGITITAITKHTAGTKIG